MATHSKSERKLLLQLAIAVLIAALARSVQADAQADAAHAKGEAQSVDRALVSTPALPHCPMPRPTGNCSRPTSR